MTCPSEPIPPGWTIWRAPVPTPLVQLAIDVRNHVRSFPFGSIARTVEWNGATVGAFVSHHTWTFRNGTLVTGLCIPGVALLVQKPTVGTSAVVIDSLDTPDPSAAVFGAEDQTDWRLVAVSGAAVVATVGLFLLAIHHAGRLQKNQLRS